MILKENIYIENLKEQIKEAEEEVISLAESNFECIRDNLSESDDYELTEEELKLYEKYKDRKDISLEEANSIIYLLKDYRGYEAIEHLEKKQKEISEIIDRYKTVEATFNVINSWFNILYCDVSRKSESVYIELDKKDYPAFIDEFSYAISSNYYEDYDEEWNECDDFKVRLSTHDVGSRWSDEKGESVYYSDEHVYVNAMLVRTPTLTHKQQEMTNEQRMKCIADEIVYDALEDATSTYYSISEIMLKENYGLSESEIDELLDCLYEDHENIVEANYDNHELVLDLNMTRVNEYTDYEDIKETINNWWHEVSLLKGDLKFEYNTKTNQVTIINNNNCNVESLSAFTYKQVMLV
ncbi:MULTISPECIES: hypothetical protein [unclassified Breznakia]|uniref:hypothetical protein n=1 Tax=unclassified Breznakia TaxID=2623764 RepID=UPI002473E4A6|nr:MULTISPECIES: hypothetical protein [unclassified Breznakia]MDH6367072.1 hypothetical protein [Breznakia sp. PH1-1]MDH6404156.1 cell division septum initiation protein DivIVA [Breznakia sp. PF1-11]MDH6411959.1 hypothetical protein [Breznakia sp. PFB1-11]MDH6414144.1 cell division septum initiation protein DivIVA [Breznakia sp. PFB1-14]MDH6418897.1 cell division septum initiation protein DivIVA [Breznakia sp. PFB1-12]